MSARPRLLQAPLAVCSALALAVCSALALAVCAALALAAAPAAAQSSPLAFRSCKATQVFLPSHRLQCATLVVPFDRSDPALGSVALAVQRIAPQRPRKGVLVLLAGGPGQPALPAFEELIAPLARDPLLKGFELVALDQRGTGQSEALACPAYERAASEAEADTELGHCGEALGATRGFYTSQESVEDLDALREGLGGTPLSLLAVSYGTRVAAMYAREHPAGVARMVLDSVVAPTGSSALYSDRLHALRRVFDEGICGSGDCGGFTRDAYGDLTRLVARLHRHPLRARLLSVRGRWRNAAVTEAGLLRLLLGLDLAPATRELVPAAVAAALHGRPAPLAQLTAGTGPGSANAGSGPAAEASAPFTDSLISNVLYAATSCVETELPWAPQSPPSERPGLVSAWLRSLPASATAPFAPATVEAVSSIPICLDWPSTPAAPPSPTGPSATPTLLLSGDDDLRTPYEGALTALASYSDGRLLRIPDAGHSTVTSDPTGCAERATIEFLATGDAPSTCAPAREAQAVALPPTSLSRVRGARPWLRRAREVASAAALTLEYLFGQTLPGSGGLQGGRWTLAAVGIALHHLSDTRGVVLSGDLHPSAHGTTIGLAGRLRVAGRLQGELTLRGRSLRGTLGGVRVRVRLGEL